MSVRELIALGTGSQVPSRYRNHNGYLLRWDQEGVLFDPGEGTQRQMIFAGVAASAITRVCVTHFHGDHCLGLAGITQRLSLDDVPHPIHVYFPASGRKYFDRLRYASIYRERATIVPHPIEDVTAVIETPAFALSVASLDHGVPTLGYRIDEPAGRTMLPEKLAELGVRGPAIGRLHKQGTVEVDGRMITLDQVSVEKPGQSVAFVMDTRPCPGALALAKDADLLVIESTYLHQDVKLAHDHMHMTAVQAAEIGKEAGARRVVLTHFSQRYLSVDPFVEEASAIHPDVVAVQDGQRVPVPKRRSVTA
ncbi:MAG: ribonuclease Z [Myxococcota bacterium]